MADQEEKTSEEELLSRQVPIQYYGTADIVGVFADQAMVSHSTGLFTLYFFQMQVPPTENIEDLKKLTGVPTRCVARIVLTPELLQQFVGAISKNLGKYNRLVEQQSQEAEK